MDAKVHFGEDAPTVRLRWVYTELPFLPLGTECVINNRKWNQDQESKLTVGQFPPVAANYVQDARWRLPAGMNGKHICNPQWLSTGEPWPTNLPDSKFGPFFIPECCGLFQNVADGGFEIGGEVGDVWDGPPGPTCATAKHATLYVTYPDTWPGASSRWWRWDTVPGQVYHFTTLFPAGLFRGWTLYDGPNCTLLTVVATAIVQVVNFTFTASSNHAWAEFSSPIGGFAYSVLLEGPPLFIDATDGGLEIGGEAGDSFRPPDATDGGFEIGGEVADVFSVPDATDGGFEIGGEAGDVWGALWTDATDGGLEIGGQVGDTFTPPGPGPTCATAFVGALSFVYPATMAPGDEQWYVFSVPSFTVMTVQITVSAGGLFGDYYFGFDCSTLSSWFSGPLMTQSSFSGAFNKLYVRIRNLDPNPIFRTVQAF